MLNSIRRNEVTPLFLVVAVIFFGLALIGVIQAYSPVPFWDMWNGYLEFFIRVNEGHWSLWWAQHNEHRIFISRLLFWVDLAWMGGSVWFLLVVNYLLLILAGLVFWLSIRERVPNQYRFIGLFIFAWLSSWCQEENLTWGFQSQFILAQLLPLSAFYLLHKSLKNQQSSDGNFVASCFLGVLSTGSMANGVIALPIMAAYGLITRMRWQRVVILGTLTGLSLIAYFYDYKAPAQHHGTLLSAIRENPSGLVQYLLLYLGGPFFYMFRSQTAALIGGGALLVSSIYFASQILRNTRNQSLDLSMLAFILFVGVTALGTAGGRLFLGVEQALSSRYTTPSLMAWSALFVILAPKVIRFVEPYPRRLWLPLLVFLVAMLPMQMGGLRSSARKTFEHKLAGLALAMDILDRDQIEKIVWNADWAMSLSETAAKKDLSIFGQYPFKDARERVGQSSMDFINSGRLCQGFIDPIEPTIKYDDQYMRINGWLFDNKTKTISESLWIQGQDGKIIGYALLGKPRPDLAAAIEPAAVNSGFTGYFLAEKQGVPATLFDPVTKCILPITLPVSHLHQQNSASFFHVSKDENKNLPTVNLSSLLVKNRWTGGDYQRTSFPGLSVYGSFIASDADIGDISLRLNRGDRILFRSGPTGGHQYLLIGNDIRVVLPVSLDWEILEFSGSSMPDNVEATFIDQGREWGEWSAIAILNGQNK